MKVFLPFLSSWKKVEPKIGAQVEGCIIGNEKWVVPNRIYHWNMRWAESEPIPELYNFPPYTYLNYKMLGSMQIIGTRTCPEWARLWPDNGGSPPRNDYYLNYARWICEIIARFEPWGVEIWNEPDCKAENNDTNYLGAWWDGKSWYSSGVRYGQFTRAIYPYIKQYSPKTKVLVGALMNVNEQESQEFLRGAVSGGLRGDYLSYHCYITERPYFIRAFALSAALKKIAKLPTICTETSVLAWNDSEELRILQHDYLQYLINSLKTPIYSYPEKVLWYSLANNHWKNSDLQRGDAPLPAWQLFRDAK